MTRREGRGKKLLKKIQNALSREVTKKNKNLSRNIATSSPSALQQNNKKKNKNWACISDMITLLHYFPHPKITSVVLNYAFFLYFHLTN